MATSIIEAIAGDRGPELSNSSGARTLLIGTNWNVIRLGILYNFPDLGSNPSGTPRFYLGMLNGAAAANSVLKSTTSNFIGVTPNVAAWTRNAGPPVYYSTASVSQQVAKKIGATLTLGTTAVGVAAYHSGAAAVRNALILQIAKGSPNWTLQVTYMNAAAIAQTDKTVTDLRQALEALTMANTATALGYSVSGVTNQAFDEVAGALDSFHYGWDKTAYNARVYVVGHAKVS